MAWVDLSVECDCNNCMHSTTNSNSERCKHCVVKNSNGVDMWEPHLDDSYCEDPLEESGGTLGPLIDKVFPNGI